MGFLGLTEDEVSDLLESIWQFGLIATAFITVLWIGYLLYGAWAVMRDIPEKDRLFKPLTDAMMKLCGRVTKYVVGATGTALVMTMVIDYTSRSGVIDRMPGVARAGTGDLETDLNTLAENSEAAASVVAAAPPTAAAQDGEFTDAFFGRDQDYWRKKAEEKKRKAEETVTSPDTWTTGVPDKLAGEWSSESGRCRNAAKWLEWTNEGARIRSEPGAEARLIPLSWRIGSFPKFRFSPKKTARAKVLVQFVDDNIHVTWALQADGETVHAGVPPTVWGRCEVEGQPFVWDPQAALAAALATRDLDPPRPDGALSEASSAPAAPSQ